MLLSNKPDQASEPEQTKLKSVRFKRKIRVRLIPDREELDEKGLITKLWFQPEDYQTIKKEAITEIRHFISDRQMHGETLTSREAAHRLFQPHVLDTSSEEDCSEEYDSEEDSSEKSDVEEYTPDVNNRYDALRIGA